MPEPLRHDGDVDAGRELQRRRAVPKIVQPLHGQPGPLRDHLELAGHVLGADPAPEGVREDAVTLRRGHADICELLELPGPVLGQQLDGAAVQVESAVLPASGLGRPDQQGALDDDDLLPDGELGPGQVDVLPAKADSLTAP